MSILIGILLVCLYFDLSDAADEVKKEARRMRATAAKKESASHE